MAVLAAALALVAVAVAIAYAAGVGHSTSSGGPLALPPEKKVSMGIPVPKGVPFSFALLGVKNTSDKPVVLDRVDLVRADPGLALVGAFGLITPQHCNARPAPGVASSTAGRTNREIPTSRVERRSVWSRGTTSRTTDMPSMG